MISANEATAMATESETAKESVLESNETEAEQAEKQLLEDYSDVYTIHDINDVPDMFKRLDNLMANKPVKTAKLALKMSLDGVGPSGIAMSAYSRGLKINERAELKNIESFVTQELTAHIDIIKKASLAIKMKLFVND